MISRRQFLRSTGAAAGLGLLPRALWAAPASLTPATLQIGWIWNVEYAGEQIALQKGYYAASGLNLNVRPGGPQVDEMVLLMARKVNAAITDVMVAAQAYQHGAKIKIIGASFQKAAFGIVSLPQKPIHTPQDLVGKKIGVPTKQTWALKFLCLANHIDPASVTMLPVSYDPAPLVNHEVDGFLSFVTNEPLQLAEQGIATVSMVFADFGLADFTGCLTVREDALKDPAQRSILAGMLHGGIRGWQDAVENPELAAKMMVARWGSQYALNEPFQIKAMKAEIPFIVTPESQKNGLLTMSAESIAANVATLSRVGVAINPGLFDTTLIEEVKGGKVRL